ncbi:hypothetical protein GCM10022285_16440 [Streptomyces tunisiensis]|uniref:Uncharacterized protein n=1 Tax=Streptomyces tunisiensis TaxID=948699 RepID=A0ABP7Y109_9ACTN
MVAARDPARVVKQKKPLSEEGAESDAVGEYRQAQDAASPPGGPSGSADRRILVDQGRA